MKRIIKDEIIAEVKTDLLYWRLNKQSYSDWTCFYCILKDKYDFCPVETSSNDIKEILYYLEREVKWRGKKEKMELFSNDWKKIIKNLIKDWEKFISKLKILSS